MLQPNSKNKIFHARTRAKAKMYEYAVPIDQHIATGDVPLNSMLDLAIAMLGDLTANGVINNLDEEKYRLLFSAQYFNSLLEAKSISENQVLLKLLSSSAYYLSGYPGSSHVLIRDITQEQISELPILEQFLFSILKRIAFQVNLDMTNNIVNVVNAWNSFTEGRSSYEELNNLATTLRSDIYSNGTDKDLLLVDIIRTLILKRFNVSARAVFSSHSGIAINEWESYFSRTNHLSELWPSQIKLAEQGVFRGKSAVIQMPTSAGKTRATELIIRSSFLSGRGTVAVIVAPFRALCQEIYNDFTKNFSEDSDISVNLVSDVLQEDFEFSVEVQKTVLILTPEKLDFLLRHNSELSQTIGLIIYDEGHLFDDGTRGCKYELLLSSLKQQFSISTQIILISAVITNAQEVKEWLIGQDGILVDGKDLSPTNRSIAFVEWGQTSRSLQFVEENDINQPLLFVPTVLKSYEIERKEGERNKRFFPKPKSGGGYETSQIAGFLGCRLSASGLSAIFVGRKDSAQKIARELIDAYGRNLDIQEPSDFTENRLEADKVISYIDQLLGSDCINAQAARLGVLIHHGAVPHGLRLVTEHALQNSHFRVVICTTTLAQGVNLPIRYLIITTNRQARDKIKVRDFHNLMGRAGRSGKYTEGTVIFADPDIYKSRQYQGARWIEVGSMLNSANSEPSKSRLHILLTAKPADDKEKELEWDINTSIVKKEITSYLLNSLIDVDDLREMEQKVTELVQSTLGYSQLETDEQKTILSGIFLEIGLDIMTRVSDSSKRLVFARSILTIDQCEDFLSLLEADLDRMLLYFESVDQVNPLEIFWHYLYKYSNDKIVKSFSEEDSLFLCKSWIAGESFLEILSLSSQFVRTSDKSLSVMDIIKMCETGFSYDISMILGSLIELSEMIISDEYFSIMKPECLLFQKCLKYGVPTYLGATIYELGFSDRNLAIELTDMINGDLSRLEIIRILKNSEAVRNKVENEYPEYFLNRLNNLSLK